MDLHALLNALGYLPATDRWVTLHSADSRLMHHYRQADKAGAEAGQGAAVVGSYVYRTSPNDVLTPARPAVFVATAETEAQARKIHKRLWNLGECPFLIVLLPGSVRVYAGFDYSTGDSRHTLIADEPVAHFAGSPPASLHAFHASAIDSGRIWAQQARHLGSSSRVDYRLLNQLRKLSRLLQEEHQLAREVAHALIGKYIYFRYLRDRRILDNGWLEEQGIAEQVVFGRHATADGIEKLANALQRRFNGDVFPLPEDDNGWRHADEAIRFLAGIFCGDSPHGQLALDFDVYDFSFIPVELLSSIYEQFLKAEGRGGADGIVYTPEPLADYVLAELEALRPLEVGDRVLDPCCGSGVFLVLAYRRLIERAWRSQGQRPSAEEMKDLLQQSIFGVETDEEACYIAAFSLIITLLSYLEPPELIANSGFQFPTLVGTNIRHSDFFSDDCSYLAMQGGFRWIVGNPPWTSADEQDPAHRAALAWITKADGQERKVGKRRLDEAFTWRAAEFLASDGYAGLLVKATTLVNSSSRDYRQTFFAAHEVRRVTNFSNLRYVLFTGPQRQRAKAPAACLIYRHATVVAAKQPIIHYGPFVADQVPARARVGHNRVGSITIYEGDIQQIDHAAAEEDAEPIWKLALWGSHQDRRALRRLRSMLPTTVGAIADERGWVVATGLHIRRSASSDQANWTFVRELGGANLLSPRFARPLCVALEDLSAIPRESAYIHTRAGRKSLKLIAAPHAVITASGAAFSDSDFVIPSPKVGIAAEPLEEPYLKAITLYLNSSLARYAHFFQNPSAGIYINAPNVETVRAIPCRALLPEQVQKLAAAYEKIVAEVTPADNDEFGLQGQTVPSQDAVDTLVEGVLGIPQSISRVAREFMEVRHQLTEGKTGTSALQPPSNEALLEYAEQLRLQLDDFARCRHQVTLCRDHDAIVATVEVTGGAEPIPVRLAQANGRTRSVLEAVRSRHSQWVYVQRSVRVFDGPRAHIVKAARLLDWTGTQANQDAADLISEVLELTAPHEPAAT